MFLWSGQKGRDAMQTDSRIGRGGSTGGYRHPLLQRINPYFACLRGLADPTARRSVRWTPPAAALAAVLMAFDPGCTLTVRCRDALACLGLDFTRRRRVGKTCNGLLKALVRQAPAILPLLKSSLRQQAQAMWEKIPRVAGWVLLAVDGSKEDLPRTRSLEEHFGIADNGRCPQALITAIVEVFTGLPWDWRIGRGRGSEKDQLIAMTADLPARSLLLADGNFVGYAVWSAPAKAGREFLIRVGGNVHLIRRLWPDARIDRRGDIVYAWPTHRQKHAAPLRLRLIEVRGGKDPVYLLTNVLDRRRLTDAAAGKIYRRRWGVELFYRGLKRTLGYAKLRSRSGRRAAVELEWGMVSLWVLAVLGIEQLHRRRISRRRLSPAGLLGAVRTALVRGVDPARAARAGRDLDRALGRAVRDRYQRHAAKASRYRPVTRNTPHPLQLKPPRVRLATDTERRRAEQAHPRLAA
jgi:hypothetical protein